MKSALSVGVKVSRNGEFEGPKGHTEVAAKGVKYKGGGGAGGCVTYTPAVRN